MDSTNIIRFLRCLSSPDKLVQDVAWSKVSDVVRRRYNKNDLSSVDIESFLNNPPNVGENRRSDVRSLWTVVKKSLGFLLCSIKIQDAEIFLVRDDSIVPASQRRLLIIGDMLNEAKNERRLQQLLEAKDQGTAFHLISKCTDSNHWIAAGAFTFFAEYRFAIKARLNLLPTKSVVQKTGKQIDVTCAWCKTQPENLAHVMSNAGMMRERPNLIFTV